MNEPTDKQLLEALQNRLDGNRKAIEEQNRLLEELEKVNQKLISSENLKSQFLSNIRNEINNPLTSILGLSKNIPNLINDKDGLEKISRLIHKEAFDLDFQLRNIFVAAELESGGLFPEITDVEIATLINQLVDNFKHLIKEKNLTVEVNYLQEQQTVSSDAEKIYLILANLLANAIEYSHPDTKIDITVSVKDEMLSISIQDYGIGIDEQYHDLIYDRFKQLESGTTKEHLGHGLGLSVTRELLDLIGGTIHLESKANQGSVFTFKVKESINDTENLTLGGNEFLFNEGEDVLF